MGGIGCKYSTLSRIKQNGIFQNSNGCFNCCSPRIIFIQPLFSCANGRPHRITVCLFFFWWYINSSCSSMNRENDLSLFHNFFLPEMTNRLYQCILLKRDTLTKKEFLNKHTTW